MFAVLANLVWSRASTEISRLLLIKLAPRRGPLVAIIVYC